MVTPNTREAQALLGAPVDSLDDARRAAGKLAEWGPRWVVIKGGHLAADDGACDVLVESATGDVAELCLPRIDTRNDHGTGCSFGAATAAGLARGLTVPEAVRAAKRFVHEGLERSAGWALGGGHGPVGKLGAWS